MTNNVATGPLPDPVTITLTVNGECHSLAVRPWTTLLDLLRETLGLTGTKMGCDQGQCGACTVLIDGTRMNACLALAVQKDGAAVTTIEGLAAEAPAHDGLHPLQAAFIEHDAFQCGYCTPGQICSAAGLIAEGRARTGPAAVDSVARIYTRNEIRELMSGNLCRCGAYTNITDAIQDVLQQTAREREAAAE